MNEPASIPFVASGPARITTAEFERMCRADVFGDATIELVDGDLQRMMSPVARHAGRQASIIGKLYGVLGEGAARLMGETVNGDYAQIATVRFGEPLAVPGTDATIVLA